MHACRRAGTHSHTRTQKTQAYGSAPSSIPPLAACWSVAQGTPLCRRCQTGPLVAQWLRHRRRRLRRFGTVREEHIQAGFAAGMYAHRACKRALLVLRCGKHEEGEEGLVSTGAAVPYIQVFAPFWSPTPDMHASVLPQS